MRSCPLHHNLMHNSSEGLLILLQLIYVGKGLWLSSCEIQTLGQKFLSDVCQSEAEFTPRYSCCSHQGTSLLPSQVPLCYMTDGVPFFFFLFFFFQIRWVYFTCAFCGKSPVWCTLHFSQQLVDTSCFQHLQERS